jgi:hypothetical protein
VGEVERPAEQRAIRTRRNKTKDFFLSQLCAKTMRVLFWAFALLVLPACCGAQQTFALSDWMGALMPLIGME